MVRIHSVQAGTPEVAAARALFTAYRDFLETIESTHCFDFPRYLEEIASLPAPYADANGELLLAFVDGAPAGCIAFRQAAAFEQAARVSCEIKRLFVLPSLRGQGLARTLIAECLRRATARGFSRAILDTDIVSMPAAYAIYRSFGFTEYTPPGKRAASLRFLERFLP